MQPKSLILLLLALGCGLVASIGITQVIAHRGQEPLPVGETVPILVARETIPAWTPLTAQLVKLEPWPKDRVPEGAISQIEAVEGRRTKTPLYPGEPLLEKKIFDKNANEHGPTVMIPKGLRVVTVKVDQVSSGSGLVLPGDRVDVAVVLRPDLTKGITEPVTQTFLQDIKVFAVNDQFHIQGVAQEETSIQAKTVSLLVTPEQAQMILVASEAGKIQLVMRSPEEQDQAHVKPLRLRDVLDLSEGADREKEKMVTTSESTDQHLLLERFQDFLNSRGQTKDSSVSTADLQTTSGQTTSPSEQWAIRLLKAAQVEDVVLEKSERGWNLADRTVYGPSGSASGGAAGSASSSSAPTSPGQNSSGDQSQGAPSAAPGGAAGPKDVGPHAPLGPGKTHPENLLSAPGVAGGSPGGSGPSLSEDPPDSLTPSGEDVPHNMVLPPLDDN